MDSSDSKNTTENTTLGFSPEENTDTNTTPEKVPLWKGNLSKRWSKKGPSKAELTDTFLDMKNSLLVQSANVVGLNRRIEILERDMADLIRYINSRI
jgi:hypothetical protein